MKGEGKEAGLPREGCGSGDLSFGVASAKNQVWDLGSNFRILISSSVHERGGLNGSFRCADCYLEPETHFYQQAHNM